MPKYRNQPPCRQLSMLFLYNFATSALAYDAVICGQNGYSESDNASLYYNADAWNSVGDGFQCMSINNDPPSFDATWRWTDDSNSVHSYPHVKFKSDELPVALDQIAALELNVQWSYSTGNDATSSERKLAQNLSEDDTRANVAFDMFADADETNAQTATTASIEIMIWIGTVGSPWPIGYRNSTDCYKQELGGVEFKLYIGYNSNNATVYTWHTATNQTGFFEDVSPLLQYLWRHDFVDADAYLGLVEYGSEAYHASSNVTLSASNFSMRLETGQPPLLTLNTIPNTCSGTTSADMPPTSRLLYALFAAACMLLEYI